jgi:signal transduction histidine kinase
MVRRIVGLIAQLSEACHSSVTLRGTAKVAARALVELFPGSSVVVFEREPGKDTVRAVTGAHIPSAWQMRAVHLTEVPMVAQALRCPKQLVHGSAIGGRRGDASPGRAPTETALEVICAAVPDPIEPLYALMFLAPKDPDEDSVRELAIESTRHILATSSAIDNGNAERARTLAAIHHAKTEWEKTADALPEVVGLVDRRRRVVRVSRGLERWSLGDVRTAIRRDLHAVLHPTCDSVDCRLKQALAKAWQELEQSRSVSFEVNDSVLGLDVVVELRPADTVPGGDTNAPWQRAAFVVSNVTAQRRAERQLTELNGTLEARIVTRTAELTATNRELRDEVARRREAEKLLRASQVELKALSERLMNAHEDERKRIAQDLHDSIGQSLSAIKYSLERAQVLARRQEPKDAASVVEAAVARVQRVMDEVRGISMNLRPALLDDLGAASAVRWLCREWHDVYHEIAIDTDIAVGDEAIPPMLGTSVFRAVQESLNNVARHAGANRVQVSMKLDAGTLSVTVQDDGSGFAINGDVRRLVQGNGVKGLHSLRERAERTGGRCDIASAPGRGTTVRLEWPIAAGLAAREANACIN